MSYETKCEKSSDFSTLKLIFIIKEN
jgi:hypothetical protein